MSTFKSVEEAREYFVHDRFATTNGMFLEELHEGGCTCSMDILETHRNALGGLMGGVIFTLADFAFAISSNNDHSPTVALDINIHFLKSSKGSRLIAKSECIKSGKTTSVFKVVVTDDLGKEIALFLGPGYKL